MSGGFILRLDQLESYSPRLRLYYQYKADCLPCTTPTIHALLHIADTIEVLGPVWAWWSFPIERECGFQQRSIMSRRFPYVNLDRSLVRQAQLDQITLLYDLSEELGLVPDNTEIEEYLPECKPLFSDRTTVTQTQNTDEGYVLLSPHEPRELDVGTRSKILASLAIQFSTTTDVIDHYLPKKLQEWGKLHISGDDEIVRTSDHTEFDPDASRDATFVRVGCCCGSSGHL